MIDIIIIIIIIISSSSSSSSSSIKNMNILIGALIFKTLIKYSRDQSNNLPDAQSTEIDDDYVIRIPFQKVLLILFSN